MTKKNKFWIALALIGWSATSSVQAADSYTGTCGSLHWNLYEEWENGMMWRLVISGDGDMPNFSKDDLPPWYYKGGMIYRIEIGAGVKSIGDYAFYNQEYIGVCWGDCKGIKEGGIYFGGTYTPSQLTRIGNHAFGNCAFSFAEITFPSNLKIIGDSAFYRCYSLQRLKTESNQGQFPESLTTIGDGAFQFCSSLDSITIPKNVTDIGFFAFSLCNKLKKINFNAENCTIKSGYPTFGYNDALTEINIGNQVKTIPDNIFWACTNVTSATIGNAVETIGERAFEYCTSLKSIIISANVTSIKKYAFAQCTSLETVNYNAVNCTSMTGYSAFSSCDAFTTLIIGNTVKTIPKTAFASCTSINSVTIGSGVTAIGQGAFQGCGMPSISISNNVKTIGDFVFAGCDSLTSVIIGNGVDTIGTRAFASCSNLNSVSIGNRIKKIGFATFEDCRNLKSLTCNAINPPELGGLAFSNVPTNIAVNINCNYLADYKKATGWDSFTNYQCKTFGCTDCYAENYNPSATIDDGSCIFKKITDDISGCMDNTALSYNPLATIDNSKDCVYESAQTIYGCNDPKSLNYNPFATEYDGSCVYADEENTFVPENTVTVQDVVAAPPQEDCSLNEGEGIDAAFITGFTQLDGNTVIIHWIIIQNGNTIFYDAEYTITHEGLNLFYLSIICKEGLRSSESGITGYTVSATYEIRLETSIYQPKLNDFTVYPNPFTDVLNILVRDAAVVNITLYSIDGKPVASYHTSNEAQIATGNLPAGVYLLKVSADGKIKSATVVKK